jgi:predicted ester cyclase
VTDVSDASDANDVSGEANKRRFVRLIEEAFNKGNLAVIDELMVPQIIEHVPGAPNDSAFFKKVVKGLRKAFPDVVYTIEDIAIDGDKVWARLRSRGTNLGPFMRRPPTGHSFDVESFEVFRFENGKMVEHWGLIDRMAVFEQLGGIKGHLMARAKDVLRRLRALTGRRA